MKSWPNERDLTIGFAHAAYQLGAEFATRGRAAASFEVRTLDELKARAPEADVIVVSGLWRNELIATCPKLRFVQSISAGTDQFDKPAFAEAGIRLASAQGGNERAVAEHAMALILGLNRQIHLARDNQVAKFWRPMIGERGRREDELGGKTLVIVGLGRIGLRLAALASAFGLRVIGVRRQPRREPNVDVVVTPDHLHEVLAEADLVALTCPLTPETEGLIGKDALAAMRPGSFLINVARGRVVDEQALLAALASGHLAGAGLDCFHDEPLPPESPFWTLPNVIATPHSAGETRAYETNVVDILLDNLSRLSRGEVVLRNQIV
ncbi:D-2-hydroxyacid dehydrogenase [Bosea caraganae]|uniref:D-2-hydroxyacid dehydrogenase n=1 Tax=Bosea caraganae TaxID=2763117 RepID=A0A370L7U3_9HYPH|nr:D-2-hydroxyacid dehydrogenase [Bosea caraganae]RDJ25118.1 D-2-hydroxyacid dehydrogenase [Bosea caraganae]RDJ26228.1 D-2-hydroxyacid dehydrogenase [Bosea caraganae]